MKYVTIHQPNFIPWVGFFAKAKAADTLVILAGVQFSKGGYQNRVKLGGSWLTVPVEKRLVPIRNIKVADRDIFPKLADRIEHEFLGTPFQYRLSPVLRLLREPNPSLYLIDHTIPLIVAMLQAFGLNPDVYVDYTTQSGDPGEALSAIVNKHGDTYLAGSDTPKYLTRDQLKVPHVLVQKPASDIDPNTALGTLVNHAAPQYALSCASTWKYWN